MLTYLTTPIRAVLLAAALAFAAQTADARSTSTDQQTTTARTKGEAPPTERAGVSVDGLLLIAGIVGAVIIFAWVCSRVGDNRRPTM
jgi:hypothetical protein